jgi:hypothetical protein
LSIVVAAKSVDTLKSPSRFRVHQFENRAAADVLRRTRSSPTGVRRAVQISASIDYQTCVRVAAVGATGESVDYFERLGCGWNQARQQNEENYYRGLALTRIWHRTYLANYFAI